MHFFIRFMETNMSNGVGELTFAYLIVLTGSMSGWMLDVVATLAWSYMVQLRQNHKAGPYTQEVRVDHGP
jgi:hypothetical protein